MRKRAGRDPVVIGATMTERKCAFMSSGEITTQGNRRLRQDAASRVEAVRGFKRI